MTRSATVMAGARRREAGVENWLVCPWSYLRSLKMGGGHAPPPRSRRMNNQKATVEVTTPVLLIATRFRVAVPPVVVAGMITTA